MPANGLIYAPQHPCACYLETKLYGFNALAPASTGPRVPESAASDVRLEEGPPAGIDRGGVGLGVVPEAGVTSVDPAARSPLPCQVPWLVPGGGMNTHHLGSDVVFACATCPSA